MEKTIKLTPTEIIKWLTFLALIISSFVVNQADVAYLKKENNERKDEISRLLNQIREQERLAAAINEKVTITLNDVTVIKNAILSHEFDGSNHNK